MFSDIVVGSYLYYTKIKEPIQIFSPAGRKNNRKFGQFERRARTKRGRGGKKNGELY